MPLHGKKEKTMKLNGTIPDSPPELVLRVALAVAMLAAGANAAEHADCAVTPPVGAKSSEFKSVTVRMCTYNIGWAAGSPTHPGCWASRRADVAALVRSSSPDVVAFQEVVPAQAGYLRGKMPEYGFAGEYRNEDRTSGQGNLVAWRRDRFELVETRTFWLSETPDVPGSKSWGSGWRRTCTLAALREKRTGVRICVASVHLDCASSLAKEEGMRLVLRRLPEFSAGAPVILAGDFNSNETDTAPMLAAKEMTYALYASETPPTGPWGTTCAGFRRKSPPMSFADAQRVPLSERCTKDGTRRYGERIDYIFVSKGVRVLDYATYDVLRPGLDLYPSDHFPVVATLMVNYPDAPHKQNNPSL